MECVAVHMPPTVTTWPAKALLSHGSVIQVTESVVVRVRVFMGWASIEFLAHHIAGLAAFLNSLGQKPADFHWPFNIFQNDLRGGIHLGLEDDISCAEDLAPKSLVEGEVHDAVEEGLV